MTESNSEFVKGLLQRRAENDRALAEAKQVLAQAQLEHAERQRAIDLLLASEGYDLKELDSDGSTGRPDCVSATTDLLAALRNPEHHHMVDDDVLSMYRNLRMHGEHSDGSFRRRMILDGRREPLGSPTALRTFAEASALLDAANHAIEDESATTRDFIRKVLIENGGPMRMVDVVEGVKLMGSTASPDTIRSVLQKMQHSGEAERPERGLYAYRAPSEPDRPVDDELTLSVALSEVEPAE